MDPELVPPVPADLKDGDARVVVRLNPEEAGAYWETLKQLTSSLKKTQNKTPSSEEREREGEGESRLKEMFEIKQYNLSFIALL